MITHPARKCVFEFLRVIMTDSLTSPTSAKSLGVIDAILEVTKNLIYLLTGHPVNMGIILLWTTVLVPKATYLYS